MNCYLKTCTLKKLIKKYLNLYNFKYLKSNVEVPAYVRGLIKRAKTKKTSLDDAMEEWSKENKKKFKNPKDEWPIIKDIWKKYANEMRNSERVKKFK